MKAIPRTIVRVCHASTPPGEQNPTTILIDEDLPQSHF